MQIILASIDVGYCNFAQYIEKFSVENIEKLRKKYESLPKNQQRKTKGPMNENVDKILNKLSKNSERIQTGVYDFTNKNTTEKCLGLDNDIRKNILKHLHDHAYLWDTCDIFVIEQQYFHAGGGKQSGARKKQSGANVDAIKIGEAVFMWFLDRYPFKTITYFGSQYKTQILGAPCKITKQQRKTWSTKKAQEIYVNRKDEDMIKVYELSEYVKRKRIKTEERLSIIKEEFNCVSFDANNLCDKIIREKQKLDDSSDACVQAQAYKYKTMVACF
jgi:hypothetical protein